VTASVSVGVVGGAGAALGMAAPVSVRLAAVPPVFAAGSPVSVSLAPVITAVTPGSAPAGIAGIELTLKGSGFTDATVVSFHRNGVRDPDVMASNVVVNADATEVTAEVFIGADAIPGRRVVRVTTPMGISTGVATNGNVFSIP
jgi:hypothetical protein